MMIKPHRWFTCLVFRLAAFACLLYPATGKTQAPEIKFKQISIEQGLSNSYVFATRQDSRGFMWFGTQDGLNRYDGQQMVVYRYIPGDKHSLSDNLIKYIYEDSKKVLWIGTLNGLNSFNPYTNSFTRYTHDAKNSNSIRGNMIDCILEDRQHLYGLLLKMAALMYLTGKRNSLHILSTAKKIATALAQARLIIFLKTSRAGFG